jgi:hypothetical protein
MKHLHKFENEGDGYIGPQAQDDNLEDYLDDDTFIEDELKNQITELTESYIEDLLDAGFSKEDILNAIEDYFQSYVEE